MTPRLGFKRIFGTLQSGVHCASKFLASPALTGLAGLATTLGIILAVCGLNDLELDRKRESAMRFVMLQHQSPYLEVMFDFSQALQELKSDQERMSDPRLSSRKIQMIGDLFISAITCRDENVCDHKVIDANFRQTIEAFYRVSRNDLLPALSCKLGDAPNTYGLHFRAYLIKTKNSSQSEIPPADQNNRCPSTSSPSSVQSFHE